MKFVFFVHSLVSCWNHGNAHFLRGVVRELMYLGHHVDVYEPENGWSLRNLLADQGEAGLAAMRRAYPDLHSHTYSRTTDITALMSGADVVIAQEWNEPWVLEAIARARRELRFLFFFHDTHHRALSDPDALHGDWMADCDAILAFGASLAEIYRRKNWHDQILVWHEAADTSIFKPPALSAIRQGLVFIGNWGDNERNASLAHYLLRPSQASGSALDVFGVRYPPSACGTLAAHHAHYRGYLPNADVPTSFAHYRGTVHVHRSYYVKHLPGIPTIRVFEALACGIPLLSAPWEDSENLFGSHSMLIAHSSIEMERYMQSIQHDDDLWNELVSNGLRLIESRHSCAIRVTELIEFIQRHSQLKVRVA